jgi:transposase-like protein
VEQEYPLGLPRPVIACRARRHRGAHLAYIKIRGQWRYLYRAIDKHGTPIDFLLTAKRDQEAAKRFFRKMLKDTPLLASDQIGTDRAAPYPPAIAASRKRDSCIYLVFRTQR